MMFPIRSGLGALAAPLVTIALAAGLSACTGPTNDTWQPNDTGEDTDEAPDNDEDGFDADVDCDDEDPDVNPGQAEVCNEVDDNCDGFVDEGFDYDGDGHYSARSCTYGDDCNDNDGDINPSEEDVPYNRVDEDCSGEDLTDVDGDGFDAEQVDGDDCDDDNAEIFPGADEIPYDGIDQDCTGSDLLDVDGDGHDSAEYGGDDCDDNDPAFNPSRMDWANDGIDHDCDLTDGREAEQRLSRAPYTFNGATNDSDLTGRQIAVCDFDGDGLDDVLISSPFGASYQGQVKVFLSDYADEWKEEMNLDDDGDITLNGSGSNAFFGINLACGDVDGDGRDDVVVTKGEINYRQWTTTYDNDFMLLIYYGDDDWLWSMDERRFDVQWTADFWSEYSSSDSSVKSPDLALGDLDGDGAEEIVLGFPQGTFPDVEQDTVYVVPGDSYSSWEKLDRVFKTTLTMADPVADGYLTGLDVSVGPDGDGDGNNDLIIGQPYYQVETDWGDGDPVLNGRLLFLSGIEADATMEDAAYASFLGGADEQIGFGGTLTTDVDGSGASDLVIAAPFTSAWASEGGAIYVLLDPAISGYDQALGDAADAVVYSSDDASQLGFSLYPAADMDGDGKQDILVRQRNETTVGSNDEIFLLGGQHLTGEVALEDAYMLSFRYENGEANTGSAVGVGDVDADGAHDFFIGASSFPTSDGRTTFATGKVYFYPSMGSPWGYSVGME